MDQFNRLPQKKEAREQKKREYIALAQKLSKVPEGFPFTDFDLESYRKLKGIAEKFPESTTPIDELRERFRAQGIKVVFDGDPKNGAVFILPFGGGDVEVDNVFPKYLMTTKSMDPGLKELILLNKELQNT